MPYKEERNRNTTFKLSMTALVKLLILSTLGQGELYGNKIIDHISFILKEKWAPSPGMIYPLLRQLEEEEYIKGRWTDPVKRTTRYYRITDEGNKHLYLIKKNYKSSIDDSIQILQSIVDAVYTS
ncbi:MAG: PadR family transcriptional regulator [Eubacteriales bacterium]